MCGSVSVSARALKEKQLELSAPNLVNVQRSACQSPGTRRPCCQKVKGQGHAVIECAAGVVCRSIRLLRFPVVDCEDGCVLEAGITQDGGNAERVV